jgi:hypothetical protein
MCMDGQARPAIGRMTMARQASASLLEATYIESLNRTVPDDIGPDARCGPADDDVIVYGDALCPQRLAVVGAVLGVVLEPDGRGTGVVCRAGAAVAGTALVLLPVRWDHGHTAAVFWRRRLSTFTLGWLHPSTVAGRADEYSMQQ